MSIAVLSYFIDGTGNKTTAQRISTYLDDRYTVHRCEINNFQTNNDFKRFVHKHRVQAVVGIHLLRAGRLLIDSDVPYIVIAGGTDMNVAVNNEDDVKVMTDVVKHASYLVVFTDSMKDIAVDIWPSIHNKVLIQPQGVCASPTDYTFKELFKEFNQVEVNFEKLKVFLLISGIRPVKDPLNLTEVISNWHSTDPSICLVIIGPSLDKEYTTKCREAIKRLHGVYMFSEILPSKVHSLMKQSVALLNSSHSEGMCSAILEAMYIGTPVIARKNEGNLSIISDGENGLIYSTIEEFFSKASTLLSSQWLKEKLIQNGRLYVQQNHPIEKEKETYVTLIQQLTSKDDRT